MEHFNKKQYIQYMKVDPPKIIPPVQRICEMSFEFEYITKANFTSETKLGDGSEDKVGSLMKN
jgi:hypothetical protein